MYHPEISKTFGKKETGPRIFFFYPISNQDKSMYLHKMFRVHRKHKITPKKAINNALKQNST